MSQGYYTEEFKRDAVAQVTDRGYSIKEVAQRLGISTKSLYYWRKVYGTPKLERKKDAVQSSEIRRLKAELARVTEERDILKKATVYFAKEAT
jgi:transposase